MARRASEAQGAGETGLSRLIQVHAFSSAGDAAVMVGLAGTLFFQVPQGKARDQVLMFLLLTMLPFAIVAPLIGPLLDRFRHGRRWSIGATLAVRAFLCWVLASSITEQSWWQFPAALGVLVSSKAYLVTRSSAAPRLLPAGLTLVKANGRLSLAGTIGAAIGGGLAGVAAQFGPAWGLRVGFVIFVVGTVMAVLLPARIDSAHGEEQAPLGDLAGTSADRDDHTGRATGIGGSLVTALRANSGLRWLSGFLTIYLAFLLREHPFPGWESRGTLLLAIVIGAAGVGNAIGTMTGALVRTASPRVIVLAMLLIDAVVAVVAAVRFNIVTATLVALVAGIGQQMGKLALDAIIQDTVAEHVRTSVFARSETLLQLSWVIGGILAVVLPLDATIGMTVAAVLLVLWTIAVVVWHSGRRLPAPARVRAVQERARRRPAVPGTPGRGRRSATPTGPGVAAPSTPGPTATERHHGSAQDPMPGRDSPVSDEHVLDDQERTIGIDRAAVREFGRSRPPGRTPGTGDDRRDRWRHRFED